VCDDRSLVWCRLCGEEEEEEEEARGGSLESSMSRRACYGREGGEKRGRELQRGEMERFGAPLVLLSLYDALFGRAARAALWRLEGARSACRRTHEVIKQG
jgi:hypothetical protein